MQQDIMQRWNQWNFFRVKIMETEKIYQLKPLTQMLKNVIKNENHQGVSLKAN